jgi:putative ubiquitin-RnfH superfamily antitoxin RatB of RatAB toxin-antitoxin module
MKTVVVTFALPERQWSWEVTLADAATAGDALEGARAMAGSIEVPWSGPIGIFGALCDRDTVPRDGDRIEIYRALKADPKESRRERVKARRAAQDRAASDPRPRPKS